MRRFPGARLKFEKSGVVISGGVALVSGGGVFETRRVARVERAATAALVPDDGPPRGPGPNVHVCKLVEATVRFTTHLPEI